MSGYICIFCEGEHPATFLQTNLTNGSTIVSCDEDMPVVLIGALAGVLGTDMQPLYDNITRFIGRQAAAEAKAAAEHAGVKSQPGPKTRRSRSKAAAAKGRTTTAQDLADELDGREPTLTEAANDAMREGAYIDQGGE